MPPPPRRCRCARRPISLTTLIRGCLFLSVSFTLPPLITPAHALQAESHAGSSMQTEKSLASSSSTTITAHHAASVLATESLLDLRMTQQLRSSTRQLRESSTKTKATRRKGARKSYSNARIVRRDDDESDDEPREALLALAETDNVQTSMTHTSPVLQKEQKHSSPGSSRYSPSGSQKKDVHFIRRQDDGENLKVAKQTLDSEREQTEVGNLQHKRTAAQLEAATKISENITESLRRAEKARTEKQKDKHVNKNNNGDSVAKSASTFSLEMAEHLKEKSAESTASALQTSSSSSGSDKAKSSNKKLFRYEVDPGGNAANAATPTHHPAINPGTIVGSELEVASSPGTATHKNGANSKLHRRNRNQPRLTESQLQRHATMQSHTASAEREGSGDSAGSGEKGAGRGAGSGRTAGSGKTTGTESGAITDTEKAEETAIEERITEKLADQIAAQREKREKLEDEITEITEKVQQNAGQKVDGSLGRRVNQSGGQSQKVISYSIRESEKAKHQINQPVDRKVNRKRKAATWAVSKSEKQLEGVASTEATGANKETAQVQIKDFTTNEKLIAYIKICLGIAVLMVVIYLGLRVYEARLSRAPPTGGDGFRPGIARAGIPGQARDPHPKHRFSMNKADPYPKVDAKNRTAHLAGSAGRSHPDHR